MTCSVDDSATMAPKEDTFCIGTLTEEDSIVQNNKFKFLLCYYSFLKRSTCDTSLS
jgi:hypothetical protein